MTRSVAFVIEAYPCAPGSPIEREMRALEERGLQILVASLRRVRQAPGAGSPGSARAAIFLPRLWPPEPRRLWRAWQALRRERGYAEALDAWVVDFRMDASPGRVAAFARALVLACELPKDHDLLHAQSLRASADVARYAAAIRRIPWSCSADAEDIWTIPEWDKRSKLEDCRWLAARTAIDARHLQNLSPAPGRVELVYHGLDLSNLPEPPSRPPRDGSDPASPVRILSVARAEEKAGLETLLEALAGLRSLHWRLVHVGGGRRLLRLRAKAVRLRIAGRLSWQPSLSADRLLAHYRTADIFALPCRIARNGGRDGLPQTLLEAQGQALACVATYVGGIPELITGGETGLLVPAADPDMLRSALAALIKDPPLRARLGAAASERVRTRFNAQGAYERLAGRFGLPGRESL